MFVAVGSARSAASHDDPALGELVVPAHVVEMGVAGDGDQLLLGDQRNVRAQADDTPAGIDQQVAVAAAQVPEIAAVEFLDVGLVDPGDAVVQATDAEPGGGIDPAHRLRPAAWWKQRMQDQARSIADHSVAICG